MAFVKSPPLLALRHAAVQYGGTGKLVLHDIDFTVCPEDRVGLVGPNGSGKTTLLLSLVGLVPLQQGELFFKGGPVRTRTDLTTLRRATGFVFQNPDDQLFSPTVLEDVAFGLLNIGYSQTEALQRSETILNQMHLSQLANRQPHTLSGGQKRLVSLATVLVMEPEILLLDEPTNDLDTATRQRVIDMLQGNAFLPHPPALVIASHDQGLLEALVNRRFELG